jgi:hypothetical protein
MCVYVYTYIGEANKMLHNADPPSASGEDTPHDHAPPAQYRGRSAALIRVWVRQWAGTKCCCKCCKYAGGVPTGTFFSFFFYAGGVPTGTFFSLAIPCLSRKISNKLEGGKIGWRQH